MTAPTVISFKSVSKHFVVRQEKSLKERLVNFRRSNIHKREFWALRDVDFDIKAGETVGLVGRNGSGKSTTLKLMGGIIHPDSGEVLVRGRIAALLELGAGFHPDLTGRENLFLNASLLGLKQSEIERHLAGIIEFSGVEDFIDTQVKFYSSGMYVRLAFSIAVHVDPDILLVDEVLAVGDEPFQHKCMERISQFQREGRTIFLVSHSAQQVAQVCDRAIMLLDGKVVADDVPAKALNVLRATYDTQIQEDLKDHSEGQDSGPRMSAEFRNLRFKPGTDEDGTIQLRTGEPLEVHAEVALDLVDPGWTLDISLETETGVGVCNSTSKRLGVSLPQQPGVHSFALRLPDLHLCSGEYSLHLGVRDSEKSLVHREANVARIKVRGPRGITGVLASPMALSFDRS